MDIVTTIFQMDFLLLFIVTISWHSFAASLRLGKCGKPEPPRNAVLSASGQLSIFGGKGVPKYRRVMFQCKVGYKAHGLMWSICGANGKWLPKPSEAGKCVYDRRRSQGCGKGQFRCQGNGACIDNSLRCDCAFDCLDGSDETNCQNPRKFIVGGKMGRKLSGALSSPGYPKKYPKNFKCTYSFITDQNYRFRVSFHEVDLKEGAKCDDFVKLSGIYRPIFVEDLSKSKSDLKSSVLVCGKDKPVKVISNSSTFDVIVNFDGGTQGVSKHKGFALMWKVIPQTSIPIPLYQNNRKPKGKIKEKLVSENYVTIAVPIAVSALVPLTLIVFICRRQSYQRQHEQQRNASVDNVNDSVGKKLGEGGDLEEIMYYEINESERSDVSNVFVQRTECQPNIFYDHDLYPPSHEMTKHNRHQGTNTSKECHDSGITRHDVADKYRSHQHGRKSSRQQHTYHYIPATYNLEQNPKWHYMHSSGITRYQSGSDASSFDDHRFQYKRDEYRPVFHEQRTLDKKMRGRTSEEYNESPCSTSCGCYRNRDIDLHGSLAAERGDDGCKLVAKQHTSCQVTISETETETTRSSLV